MITPGRTLQAGVAAAAVLGEAWSSEPCLCLALRPFMSLRTRSAAASPQGSPVPSLWFWARRWVALYVLAPVVGLVNWMLLQILRKVTYFFLISERGERQSTESSRSDHTELPWSVWAWAVEDAGCRAAEEAPALRGRAGLNHTASAPPGLTMACTLWLDGWRDCAPSVRVLDWVLSQVPPALWEQGRWASDATQSWTGQSNGLRQAKMEVTWGLAQAVSSCQDSSIVGAQACLGSSMQEAGFQATNAFTGENSPHLNENAISTLRW